MHVLEYLSSSLRRGARTGKKQCLLIKNMGNQLVYLQVAVSLESQSLL